MAALGAIFNAPGRLSGARIADLQNARLVARGPQAMLHQYSAAAIDVVMALTSGWKFSAACAIIAASSTTETAPEAIVDQPQMA